MMSRSGYTDDVDGWALIRWRGQVASALRGKRGQKFLADLLAALDAMPVKELINEDLVNDEGQVCALGALGQMRGIDVASIDPYDRDTLADVFDIAMPLACEVMYENDEWWREEPATRWNRMYAWAKSYLKEELNAAT